MIPAPENITHLEPNEIFVFGSNTAGRHGKGAAHIAQRKFGARNGDGMGRTGQCYAIATKDRNLRVLALWQISVQVERFKRYAIAHPELTFLVTRVGCGLAHYNAKDIAPFFKGSPENVRLPSDWLSFT